MSPLLIGLVGKKRAGKDSFASILVEKYCYKRLAFADPIKHVCRHLFDFNEDQLNGDAKEIVDERWCIAPREAFQIVGTDFVRHHLNEDHFIKLLDGKRSQISTPVVISDVRFPNEAAYVLKHGGILVKIERNIIHEDAHVSEAVDTIRCDYTIENNGNLEQYNENCIQFFEFIKNKKIQVS
jgi:hypothetical protein